MRTKINIYVLAILSWALVMTGCSSVDTQVDRSADFSSYKTFSWMEPQVNTDNPKFKGPLVEKNIKSSVENELAAKGIMRDDQNPDFLIGYHTYTEEKQRVDPGYSRQFMSPYYYGNPYYGFYGNPYYGGFYDYGGFYGGGYATGPTVYNYTEGTLVLDIVDTKTNELVWRGAIDGAVDDIGDLDAQIEKGVHAILKKYPADDKDRNKDDQSM